MSGETTRTGGVPEEAQSEAARAGVAAGQDAPRPQRVKKILVFMATSTRNLVDPARAAQVGLRDAIDAAIRDDPDSYETGKRAVEVHVLVHGFQLEGRQDLGSMEFEFAHQGTSVGWGWKPRDNLRYIPGDDAAVGRWVRAKLDDAKLEVTAHVSAASTVDSTMLVFWGHGQGVGTTLTLPRRLRGNGAIAGGSVQGPGLLNIGGLRDRELASLLDKWDSRKKPNVLRKGKFDLLVFDSCLMAGAELAYEYRDVTRYLIASQTLVRTAPGGPPGLNLGAVVGAFLQPDAWLDVAPAAAAARAAARPPRSAAQSTGADSEPNLQELEEDRRLLEAATDIVDLIGESRSGAQQLTLFRLDRLPDQAGNELDVSRNWLANPLDPSATPGPPPQPEPPPPPEPRPPIVEAGDNLQAALGVKIGITGLMWLFARLLGEASSDAGERERILVAFRSAAFTSVRQFLDLRDLARHVHELSRQPLLQLVALALYNELTPRPDGFVVAHRAALRFEDKLRLGGVSVYCPWFRASRPSSNDRIFNVTIDHERYRTLALPDVSGWAAFVLGPLFEATGEERRPRPQTPDAHELCLDLFERLLRRNDGRCRCDDGGAPHGRGEADDLGVKPSGDPLGPVKPSNDSLGPDETDYDYGT